ncbi:hypothetical protein CYMTET_36739, partial [Cymbomonas tetramitiformis]
RLLGEGDVRPRKVVGAVVHDVGSPSEEPWKKVNAYNFQDVSRWKDLPSKFVLQVYRDYVQTKSLPFLREMWPHAKRSMEFLATFDLDGDGLIENSGFPDQTYDIWTVEGPSAYTGGLWVAALTATYSIAELLGDEEAVEKYKGMTERARKAYQNKLWNSLGYFNYDASGSGHSDSIMADQLAGQWYCRACGLPPVVDSWRAASALKK